MEWLIAGLGNPGDRYQRTRHNVGFMVVEELSKKLEAGSWKLDKKFKADKIEVGKVLLVKPQTFMNLSGEAVGGLARFYKIPAENVVVIHDDLDLAMGAIKSGVGKGPKQHNGILSVERNMGTQEFWRVRVGVDGRAMEERRVMSGQDYVLLPLSKIEEEELKKTVEQAVDKVMEVIGDE